MYLVVTVNYVASDYAGHMNVMLAAPTLAVAQAAMAEYAAYAEEDTVTYIIPVMASQRGAAQS